MIDLAVVVGEGIVLVRIGYEHSLYLKTFVVFMYIRA